MKTATINETHKQPNTNAARQSVFFSIIALTMLLILHLVSAEFSPSWRMVSEYALGSHQWALTVFFICWGISSWMLAVAIWPVVNSKAGKTGLVLLMVSGVGEALAALFDVEHGLHGLAGFLGVPMLPIAAVLISYHLKRKQEWEIGKKQLLFCAHATWVSLLLLIGAIVLMMNGFQEAGIAYDENSGPPQHVPDSVIAVGGYANRLLILTYVFWLIFVAKKYAVKS